MVDRFGSNFNRDMMLHPIGLTPDRLVPATVKLHIGSSTIFNRWYGVPWLLMNVQLYFAVMCLSPIDLNNISSVQVSPFEGYFV